MLTELKTPQRRYLCREDYLAEGARLLRQVETLGTKSTQDAYAAWLERAQPTKGEMASVLRMARNRVVVRY